jgi:hypothetical protein
MQRERKKKRHVCYHSKEKNPADIPSDASVIGKEKKAEHLAFGEYKHQASQHLIQNYPRGIIISAPPPLSNAIRS